MSEKVAIYKNQDCGGCKFMAQGKTCCYCSHKKQTDESLKNYTYWSFGIYCELFEPKTLTASPPSE